MDKLTKEKNYDSDPKPKITLEKIKFVTLKETYGKFSFLISWLRWFENESPSDKILPTK